MDLKKKILPVSGIILFSSFLIFLSSLLPYYLADEGFVLKEGVIFDMLMAASSFVLMFIVPVLVIRLIFKKDLKKFGLRTPHDLKAASKYTASVIILFIPVMLFLSHFNSFQEFYSSSGTALTTKTAFFLLSSIIYFISEEFLFRGFLLYSVYEKLGENSVWITSLFFALFHFGKLPLEIIFSFVLGLILGHITLKTKSFLPAFVVHFILATCLNLLVIY